MQNIDAVVVIQLNLSMSDSLSSLYAFIIDLTNGNTFHLQTRLILDAQISASCLLGNMFNRIITTTPLPLL